MGNIQTMGRISHDEYVEAPSSVFQAVETAQI